MMFHATNNNAGWKEIIYIHVDLLESSDLCCLCSEGPSDSEETERTFTTDSHTYTVGATYIYMKVNMLISMLL